MNISYVTTGNYNVTSETMPCGGYVLKMDRPVEVPEFVRNERIAMLREVVFPKRPELDFARAKIVTEAYQEMRNEPIEILRAKVIDKILTEMPIYLIDNSLLAGSSASMPRAGKLYPEFGVNWLVKELDTMPTRKYDPFYVRPEDKEYFMEVMVPFWKGRTQEEWVSATTPPDLKEIEGKFYGFGLMKNACGSGHIALPCEEILKIGYQGYKQRCLDKIAALTYEDPEDVGRGIFYNSVIIAMDAATKFIKRYSVLAREAAEAETREERRKELLAMADNCDWIAENPAANYWQAVQMMFFNYLFPMISNNNVGTQVGRMDQYLYPYLKKDLEEGVITQDFAQDILENWFCIHNADAYIVLDEAGAALDANYPMGGTPTCGGQDKYGNDATNLFSHMMLAAERNTRAPGPELCTRIHRGTPDEFLKDVCETIAIGTGKPKLLMDETFYERAEKLGWPIEEVREYQAAYCAENAMSGSTYWVPEGAQILGGFAAYVDITLHNGYSSLFNEKFGIETGDPRTFKTFDELMDAYKKQVAYLIKRLLPARQIIAQAHGRFAPDPFLGAFMHDCIEKGLGWEYGGARYNTFGYMTIGSACAGNSLYAVKKLVFDDKKITMDELMDALDSNFAGPRGQEIRNMCLKVSKYGNDDDEVDSLVVETVSFEMSEYAKYRGPQGGTGTGTYDAVTAHIPHGKCVGATPDGRMSGDALNEGGVSPYQGTDLLGPTAGMKSVCKLPWTDTAMYGGVYNLKLDPKTVCTEEGIKKFMSLVRTFNRLGGQEIQFNVVDEDTLKAAQETPDDYASLVVRVAGYSSYFTGLDREIQDEIISRTENKL